MRPAAAELSQVLPHVLIITAIAVILIVVAVWAATARRRRIARRSARSRHRLTAASRQRASRNAVWATLRRRPRADSPTGQDRSFAAARSGVQDGARQPPSFEAGTADRSYGRPLSPRQRTAERIPQCPRCGDLDVLPGLPNSFRCERESCRHEWTWTPSTPWPPTTVLPPARPARPTDAARDSGPHPTPRGS